MAVLYVILFIIGACIGSFMNVLIYRLPRDMSIVRPSSMCPSCGKKIKPYENIPIVSYIVLQGKCSKCKASIPIRYFVVELITGFSLPAMFAIYGFSIQLLTAFLFFCLLTIVFFADMETMIIPNPISIGGMVVGLSLSAYSPFVDGLRNSFLGAFVGFTAFMAILLGYKLIRKREGMGWGDVKLMGMIGAFTGPIGVYIATLVGSLTAGVYGIATRQKGEFPFGPFLCIGGGVGAVCGKWLLDYWL